jgi:glycosyltransferase involved in cell wall biosynthesis
MRKITVVVNGRFHAFDYAAELNKLGVLYKLISTMPYSKAKKFGIPRERYCSLFLLEILKKIWQILFKRDLPVVFYSKLFNFFALRNIPIDSDTIIANAGYALEIFQNEKFLGIKKILDRGSTHAISNIQLNKLAADYHSVIWNSNGEQFLRRELLEYSISDKILVPTTFVGDTFIENGIAEGKLIKIPYPLSLKKFDGLNKTSKVKSKSVLYVGQISPLKGIGVLVDAMKLVRESTPDVELWLVGPMNPMTRLSVINFPWIKYYGVQKGQNLYDRYMEASVYCMLSYQEGMSLTLAEAAFCELPIVATRNSGVLELDSYYKNYSIVPVGEPIATAIKIIEALNNCGNSYYGDFEVVQEKNYSWFEYTQTLLKLI